jgi:NAD+ kinase
MIPTVAPMTIPENIPQPRPTSGVALSSIGLVVHPTRSIGEPVSELQEWSGQRGVNLVQIRGFSDEQRVAAQGDAADCDLIVSIGGDGTTLAAVRAGVAAGRPVLGIACGSLGALTSVAVGGATRALERFRSGDWVAKSLPALDVQREDGEPVLAFNDIAIVRAGDGQVRVTAHVDGALFARISGDGCIVSTPVGSSAYSLSAGGPLLAPATGAFVLTPLSVHGGSCPPFVIAAGSQLVLDTTAGYGGARLEVDGQMADTHTGRMTIGLRTGVATVVAFADQEPLIAGLRRRQIITDSPRILAEDARLREFCD